jgi:aerobic carbon-monoxide dehydrogenase medium subunit
LKPSRFSYAVPQTLEEAVALKREYGDEAKILAGGQSLVPMMNFRMAQPSVLIDISRIPGLDSISDANGGVTVGTMARQTAVQEAPSIKSALPVISDASRYIGHVATRARGTFGGSAAHADPVAEIPSLLCALDASLTARGPSGDRTIAADDFFKGYFTTDLAGDELLLEVHIPADPSVRATFLEVTRRHGDFALVSVAVALKMDGDTVSSARIVIGGVAEVPVRASDAEAALEGARLEDSTAADAGRLVSAALSPGSDVHATGVYRKRTAGVLTERAIKGLK